MLSTRSKRSLCQLLALLERGFLTVLCEKYGLDFQPDYWGGVDGALNHGLNDGSTDQITELLDEVIRTKGDLRSRTNPRYRFDERWEDLRRCLERDG